MRPGVLDASPVIVLARAGLVELLPRLLSPISMPGAVAEEIQAGPPGDPACQLLTRKPDWIAIVESSAALPPLDTWRLGRGETEVLEYARRHPSTVAVVDDKAARRAARALELPVIGTLGLLSAAAQSGLVPSFLEALEAAKRNGLYVAPEVEAALLER